MGTNVGGGEAKQWVQWASEVIDRGAMPVRSGAGFCNGGVVSALALGRRNFCRKGKPRRPHVAGFERGFGPQVRHVKSVGTSIRFQNSETA